MSSLQPIYVKSPLVTFTFVQSRESVAFSNIKKYELLIKQVYLFGFLYFHIFLTIFKHIFKNLSKYLQTFAIDIEIYSNIKNF
jgi:hypothetical protein